ncbi:MAG TPA: GNAT family N-acetyltransferase [Candidatus Tumulicola sp.]
MPADASALVPLFAQLGYPNDAATIERMVLRCSDRRKIYVGEIQSNVVGFIAVEMRDELADCEGAEILALSVDENNRSNGIGAALLRTAEEWAREQGARRVRVRSNVIRKDAHRFYEREEYAPVKDQRVFEKRS